MGRYQYELSHCCETSCCYNIPNTSNNTFVNACYNCNYDTICLRDVSCTGTDWNTATGFIHWGISCSGNYFKPLQYYHVLGVCFGKDRLIVNNFPTDRIVIVGMYGFLWANTKEYNSRLHPVAQRQIFILPSGQGACFITRCAIGNLGYNPDGSCIYPNWSNCAVCAFPYFLSVESYPLPVLNSNGLIGENGYNTWVKPTAICSTGSISGDSCMIPIYCNNQYIDCDLSCFVSPENALFSPAIKGKAAAPWSLGGKLSSDSHSSARDAYVLVSSCGPWNGECGTPDNLAMIIANNTFPTGGCRWSSPGQTSDWNKLSYAMGMIECCVIDGYWPKYGPGCAACANNANCYCVPIIGENSRIVFDVPPMGDKLTAHMTSHTDIQTSDQYYGRICAYSTACFANGQHRVCNPLGYWTLNWGNGNSYYAVNTHC